MTCSLQADLDIHKELWYDINNAGDKKSNDVDDLLKKIELKIVDPDHASSKDQQDKAKEPSKAGLYTQWPSIPAKSLDMDPSWPSAVDCATRTSVAPKWNEYPTVFLSPENAGFQ